MSDPFGNGIQWLDRACTDLERSSRRARHVAPQLVALIRVDTLHVGFRMEFETARGCVLTSPVETIKAGSQFVVLRQNAADLVSLVQYHRFRRQQTVHALIHECDAVDAAKHGV